MHLFLTSPFFFILHHVQEYSRKRENKVSFIRCDISVRINNIATVLPFLLSSIAINLNIVQYV